MLPRSIAVLPCHLGWRTLLKCDKTNHACLQSKPVNMFSQGPTKADVVLKASRQMTVCDVASQQLPFAW
jgi:hypothetical protein